MASIELTSVSLDPVMRDSAAELSGWTFVFGAARSGTTWLAKLLDSCPDVLYVHEPFIKGAGLAYHRAVSAIARGAAESAPLREDIAHELIAVRGQFVRPPLFWKRYQRGHYLLRTLKWHVDRMIGLNRLQAGRLSAPVHLVLKEGLSTSSLPLARHLAVRAIVLFRHPCAVVNSHLRGQRCGAMQPVDRRALLDACESLGSLPFSSRQIEAMNEEEALALDWLITYWPVAWLAEDCPPHVQWVTYEALVDNSERVLRQLFNGCGLPWTAHTMRFLMRSSQTGSSGLRSLLGGKARYFGVERRVDDPAHQWRSEMSPAAIARVLAVAEHFPLAKYWPEPPPCPA